MTNTERYQTLSTPSEASYRAAIVKELQTKNPPRSQVQAIIEKAERKLAEIEAGLFMDNEQFMILMRKTLACKEYCM